MATPTKAPTPEEILEDGINDGRYANILDTINVNMDNPMLQCVIQFARDYHKERLREELINCLEKIRVQGFSPDGYHVWSKMETKKLVIKNSLQLVDEYLNSKEEVLYPHDKNSNILNWKLPENEPIGLFQVVTENNITKIYHNGKLIESDIYYGIPLSMEDRKKLADIKNEYFNGLNNR